MYREIRKLLPAESLVYLGDTARIPYGNKSEETVLKYALQDAAFLEKQKVKLIVVACNTATAFALSELQKTCSVPVIGVIEPGARAAVENSKDVIGVIGTEGTIRSGAYNQTIKKLKASLQVVSVSTPLFVPLVEEPIQTQKILYPIFDHYLSDMIEAGIDTLLLGCTHYPMLTEVLREYLPSSIQIVDSANTTALAVKEVLSQKDLINDSNREGVENLYVTDAPQRVQRIAQLFLGKEPIDIQWANL